MTYFLLTEYVDHESETPLLLTEDLEAAKAAAIVPPDSQSWFGIDGYMIYQAEPGTKPVPILEGWIVARRDPATGIYHYCMAEGWTQL